MIMKIDIPDEINEAVLTVRVDQWTADGALLRIEGVMKAEDGAIFCFRLQPGKRSPRVLQFLPLPASLSEEIKEQIRRN